jgi:Tfp pilus assembly protein PilO
MKWLPREKRNPFIIVVLITAVVLALICFGLIRSQNDTLSAVADSRKSAGDKLQDMETAIKNADMTASQLTDVTFALSRAEEDMASGDLYSWTASTMRLFKQQYKVEIPDVGHPVVADVDLLPSFPYKQLRFSINGRAYYHDLGKFVADFENAFPHARMVNLVIEPAGVETEQLSFRMEIIALVKPNAS